MSTLKLSELKVYNVAHLKDLIRRNHDEFRLEAKVWPSGEIRSLNLYIDPLKGIDDFGYYVCHLVLNDQGKLYRGSIYCPGNWSAHEIAEETAKWS